jgi:hypothetical protein
MGVAKTHPGLSAGHRTPFPQAGRLFRLLSAPWGDPTRLSMIS